VSVSPGRRDQRSETVHEFERRQDLADAPARSRLVAFIDEVFRIDLAQPFGQWTQGSSPRRMRANTLLLS